MSRTDYYRHNNSTDNLYALPFSDGAWSATGAIVGDDSAQPGLYVFDGLGDGGYEIFIRAGASPASTDVAIAVFDAVCQPTDDTLVIVSPATADALQNIRNNILARIQEVTAKPKPNYNIDGQQVSWQSYFDSLMKQLEAIDNRIALTQEPFEIISRGVT